MCVCGCAQVVFIDTSESEDLSAVQADQDSSYKAEDTSFVGFVGEVRFLAFCVLGRCLCFGVRVRGLLCGT